MANPVIQIQNAKILEVGNVKLILPLGTKANFSTKPKFAVDFLYEYSKFILNLIGNFDSSSEKFQMKSCKAILTNFLLP